MDAFLVPDFWETLSLACKIAVYYGLASVAGGNLFLVLYSDGSRDTTARVFLYCGLGALLGFQGAGLSFLVQVGQINGAGLSGMFDLPMSRMLMDTQLGDVTLYRLLGFGVAFATSAYGFIAIQRFNRPPQPMFYRRLFTISCFALMGLSLSFRLIGHVSVLSPTAQLAIAIHVLSFGFWIGILYPLYILSGIPNLEFVQVQLRKFGRHAAVLLLFLGAAGGLLLWELFHSWSEFTSSPYGLSVLTKLALVLGILGVAALNKFKLVPAVVEPQGIFAFRKSLRLEACLALLILLVTAYFSTVIGPANMDH